MNRLHELQEEITKIHRLNESCRDARTNALTRNAEENRRIRLMEIKMELKTMMKSSRKSGTN
jgi:hypothetical protein